MRQGRFPAFALLAILGSPPLSAVEVRVADTAITAALKRDVFRDAGKYHLIPAGSCAYSFLENPSVAIQGDRVAVRAHLSSRAAVSIGGDCVGPAESFDVTVSGRPTVSGSRLSVVDLRIDEPGGSVNSLISAVLLPALANALTIDVEAALRRNTATGPFALTVNRVALSNLRTEGNALVVAVDGAVQLK